MNMKNQGIMISQTAKIKDSDLQTTLFSGN